MFSIGGGYSSVDSLVGTIDLAQRNFLAAAGRSRSGSAPAPRRQQGTLSFTEPWLFDRPLSAGFDIYKNIRKLLGLQVRHTGLGLRLSHPFEEYWRWLIGYRLSRDNITDIPDNASRLEGGGKGVTITSAIGLSLTRDSRDLVAAPTKGAQTALSVDSPGLGGDSKFSS
jgi:outer membrane protein insertion porin family